MKIESKPISKSRNQIKKKNNRISEYIGMIYWNDISTYVTDINWYRSKNKKTKAIIRHFNGIELIGPISGYLKQLL